MNLTRNLNAHPRECFLQDILLHIELHIGEAEAVILIQASSRREMHLGSRIKRTIDQLIGLIGTC
jgi:hypothetical protein